MRKRIYWIFITGCSGQRAGRREAKRVSSQRQPDRRLAECKRIWTIQGGLITVLLFSGFIVSLRQAKTEEALFVGDG